MPKQALRLLLEARAARQGGPQALVRRQRDRLAVMVAHARTCSPYYRRRYQGLPERITDPRVLPSTTKAALMAHFDEWVTDPALTLADVQAFVSDPALIGHRLLGRYTVATSSGTTGVRGLYLLDDRSRAVTAAMAGRMLRDWLTPTDLVRIFTRGGRLAVVAATGGHFASGAVTAGLRRGPAAARIGAFSVHDPLPQLVEQLNAFDPAVLAPYAATGELLAAEQDAGRLDIHPVLVVLAAEGLAEGGYAHIAEAFGATVRHSYAATECPFLSYSCAQGWLHVNSDWVLLEPVDADHAPVPAGQPSHTVLVSNLANRVQPILRNDLGDSVLVRPDPCPCANPLPALRVQGRTADLLPFSRLDGTTATLTPLTLSSALDRVPDVQQSQIIQTGPASLALRLRPAPGTDPTRAGRAACDQLRRVLIDQTLAHVRVTLDPEPPQLSAGGKLRTVIPWKPS
ncbi:phenylacetate--CoA ligase family protein [Micrococcus terreus]|uniref:Phenylacetate-coenzyme A ligase PaaK, adenylate-forming domain family n=1 Tax=Micrococcus terreus TaxID=574650 RepID=A0A1I7MLM8_9MICC|nr:phenylacetate--CoA ligase family protein [Micrococcus terreus]SFV22831.1 Phenylacetate-coenzyme A ligase PaaK, adenylate-forming domain family [Micrococcus terreus]